MLFAAVVFDQTFPLVADEVSTTFPPAQKVSGPLAVIVGTAGFGFTVTKISFEVPVAQEAALVNVTDIVWLTVMLFVCSPVDQRFPVLSEDVMVTLPPWQKVVGPEAVIDGVKEVVSVVVISLDSPEQPFPSVTVTEITSLSATVMLLLVSPVDQRFPVVAEDVIVTLPPVQKVVAPPAVIVGAGFAFTVTAVIAEVPEQPLASV